MNGIELLALALAAYRLSRMLAMEDGPFDVFVRIRARFDPLQTTWLGRGVNCPLCVGFWASLFVLAVWFIPGAGPIIVTWWAISGAQTVIQRVIG